MHSPACRIDVRAVRRSVSHCDYRAKPAQQTRSDFAHRSVRAIQNDTQTAKPGSLGEMGDQALLISLSPTRRIRCRDLPTRNSIRLIALFGRAAQVGDAFLDFAFIPIAQLCPIRREYLDAVVFVGIVRSGNHHAAGVTEPLGEKRDGRRGYDAGILDNSGRPRDTLLQSFKDPRTRHASVLSHEDLSIELLANRLSDRGHGMRIQREFTGARPDAIGSK